MPEGAGQWVSGLLPSATSSEDTIMSDSDKLRPNEFNPNRMTKAKYEKYLEELRRLGRLPRPIVARQTGDGGNHA